MKKLDTIKLSYKNLFNNFTRSLLTLITLVLLSSIIILMCNFCYYFKKTTDSNILNDIHRHGTFITFSIKKDLNGNFLLDKIETKDIDDFINRAEELNLMQGYYFEYVEPYSEIPLAPFIGGHDNIEVLKGESFSYQDRGKNYIWLNEEISISKNINLGDKITIETAGAANDFIVKGITDASFNYIDYSYFEITDIEIYQQETLYYDNSMIKTIQSFTKTAPKNTTIQEGSIYYNVYYFVLGISAFLVLFCTLFSLASILNVLKISIEENNYSIGIMKCLGMNRNNVFIYILTQMFILIMLSTLISTLISWIITTFTINLQIEMVGKMFYYEQSSTKSGFNFLLPLINLLILGIFLFLGSLQMLKKYAAKDVIKILQEVK